MIVSVVYSTSTSFTTPIRIMYIQHLKQFCTISCCHSTNSYLLRWQWLKQIFCSIDSFLENPRRALGTLVLVTVFRVWPDKVLSNPCTIHIIYKYQIKLTTTYCVPKTVPLYFCSSFGLCWLILTTFYHYNLPTMQLRWGVDFISDTCWYRFSASDYIVKTFKLVKRKLRSCKKYKWHSFSGTQCVLFLQFLGHRVLQNKHNRWSEISRIVLLAQESTIHIHMYSYSVWLLIWHKSEETIQHSSEHKVNTCTAAVHGLCRHCFKTCSMCPH